MCNTTQIKSPYFRNHISSTLVIPSDLKSRSDDRMLSIECQYQEVEKRTSTLGKKKSPTFINQLTMAKEVKSLFFQNPINTCITFVFHVV